MIFVWTVILIGCGTLTGGRGEVYLAAVLRSLAPFHFSPRLRLFDSSCTLRCAHHEINPGLDKAYRHSGNATTNHINMNDESGVGAGLVSARVRAILGSPKNGINEL